MVKRERQGSYDVSRTDCISSRNGGNHVYRQQSFTYTGGAARARGLGGYRMMMVRCILAETTMPERIRPRIEIWPVKGHFLSMPLDGEAKDNATNISSLDGLLGGLEAQTNVLVPSLLLCLSRCFGVLEDVRLLEEGSLRLHCQFGHGGLSMLLPLCVVG